MITRIPGTHDMLDMRLYNAVLKTITEHLTRATFAEINTPLIEHTELFTRSLGLGTDVVNKEMYYVASAHAAPDERTTLCLRPEATAAVMRAYLSAAIQEHPWKVFTVGPMFRHERPQKGRYRQFHQVSIEIINAPSLYEDALVLLVLDRLFAEGCGLRDHVLMLNYMGCSNDKTQYTTRIRTYAQQHTDQLCITCKERTTTNVLRIFDCKHTACQNILAHAPRITDHLCTACSTEWSSLQEILQQLSINYLHAPQLVRGLDYYEKTVFEFTNARLGAQATFCGGGRYNKLATEIGGKTDAPSVGAAIGIERLLLLVADTFPLIPARPLYLIIPMSTQQQPLSMHVFDLLHARGYVTDILLSGNSMKSMMRTADKRGAHACLILGSDEQAAGTITIKHMTTGKMVTVSQSELLQNI